VPPGTGPLTPIPKVSPGVTGILFLYERPPPPPPAPLLVELPIQYAAPPPAPTATAEIEVTPAGIIYVKKEDVADVSKRTCPAGALSNPDAAANITDLRVIIILLNLHI
jgi:hypothetical protein